MEIDPITRRIIAATQRRFDACPHGEISEPPPGKKLRVCIGCGCRLLECSFCPAMTFTRADISDSGWMKGGTINGIGQPERTEWYACERCSRDRD